MSRYSTKFKRWFWSAHVQDQFRSSTVDILWIALTLADGNLVDLLVGIYSGDPAIATVSGASLLLSRILVRTSVLYVLKRIKTKFPALLLPRDFATSPELYTSGTRGQGDLKITLSKGIDPNRKKNYN